MTPASTNSGHRPPAAEPSPSAGTTSDQLNNPAQGAWGLNTVEVDDELEPEAFRRGCAWQCHDA